MSFLMLEQTLNHKYRLRFIGPEEMLADFLWLVVQDDYINFNFLSGYWEVEQDCLDAVMETYQHLDIMFQQKSKKKSYGPELDAIGETMKLKPFMYQKEAIKFSLDKRNALIILPCGSGREYKIYKDFILPSLAKTTED